MSSLVNYKGLEVVSPDPTGAGGLAIQNDFKKLVDWHAKSVWEETSDPTTDDDINDEFYPGSLWLNATTETLFICIKNDPTEAKWQQVQIGSPAYGEIYASGDGFDLDFSSSLFITVNEGNIGHLDPSGNVIQDGTDKKLKIGPGGAGMYAIHISASTVSETLEQAILKFRLMVNAEIYCRIAFFLVRGEEFYTGGAGAASGFFELMEDDVITTEVQLVDGMDTDHKIYNYHIAIHRVSLI